MQTGLELIAVLEHGAYLLPNLLSFLLQFMDFRGDGALEEQKLVPLQRPPLSRGDDGESADLHGLDLRMRE